MLSENDVSVNSPYGSASDAFAPPSLISTYPPLLDLSQVAPHDCASTWKGQVASIFPGVSIKDMPRVPHGDIQLVRMGAGSLWSVRSSAASVHYRPSPSMQSTHVSLMLQAAGEIGLRQGDRRCEVAKGDMSLLDENEPFTLSGLTGSRILFVRMPRALVANRYPRLVQRTALVIDSRQPGANLVRASLMNIIATLPLLTERQRAAALAGFIHLLGVLAPEPEESSSSWRVQAALEFIERNYPNTDLRAEDVATSQRISRRRLDALVVAATGRSLTAQIWHHRLEQAARDLGDPSRSEFGASQVAYANGFNQPAHFSRAFKKRFGLTPLQFRNQPRWDR